MAKRICKAPFERVYVAQNANVCVCAWNYEVLGNLLENNIDEIWNGEKANQLRKDFLEGNMRECREEHCPFCIQQNDYIFFDSEEEAQEAYKNLPDAPIEMCLAYDMRCNHVCPSCRYELYVPDKNYSANMKTITGNVEPYIQNVRMLDCNGGGEIFACPEMMDMLSRFNPTDPDCKIYFETNGVLFKDNWHKVEHLSNHYLTVSVTPNSFDRATYKYLAGKDDLDKFNESFELMSQLRAEGKIDYLRVTMVVQDSNFRQIPDFIQNCLDHNADDIVLRPIFKFFCLSEDDWFFKNVQNPAHPYHKEYMEILDLPICKSDKVFDWGISQKQEAVTFREYFGGAPRKSDTTFVKNHLKALWETIDKKKVVIYGTGNIGKVLIDVLTNGKRTANIVCMAESDAVSETKYYYGHEIRSIDRVTVDDDTKIIIATVRTEFKKEMVKRCKELNIPDDNIVCIDELSVCEYCE